MSLPEDAPQETPAKRSKLTYMDEKAYRHARGFIIEPKPSRPDISALAWKPDQSPPFIFDFINLKKFDPDAIFGLTFKLIALLNQTSSDLGVEIATIMTLGNHTDVTFAQSVAYHMNLPWLTFKKGGFSRSNIWFLENQGNSAAFIETSFTDGDQSFEAVERAQDKSLEVPIHASVVSWGLESVRSDFLDLGTAIVSLASVAELRADPRFSRKWPDQLEGFDQWHRSILAWDAEQLSQNSDPD